MLIWWETYFYPCHIIFFCKIFKLYPNCSLYVGLMADDEAEKYKRKPIFNINERVCCLEACKYVTNQCSYAYNKKIY